VFLQRSKAKTVTNLSVESVKYKVKSKKCEISHSADASYRNDRGVFVSFVPTPCSLWLEKKFHRLFNIASILIKILSLFFKTIKNK